LTSGLEIGDVVLYEVSTRQHDRRFRGQAEASRVRELYRA